VIFSLRATMLINLNLNLNLSFLCIEFLTVCVYVYVIINRIICSVLPSWRIKL